MSESDGIMSPTPHTDADTHWTLLGDLRSQ